MKTLSWNQIPQRTRDGNYGVDVSWEDLEDTLGRYISRHSLDLCPDFQRGHVWTPEQRRAYIESKLTGGVIIDIVRFNHPGWSTNYEGQMVCVDGLQRLTTARMFLRDEIEVFGGYKRSQIAGGRIPFEITFRFNVNALKTRAEVLKWYLELNAGGTPHSPEEIARVAGLLEQELAG